MVNLEVVVNNKASYNFGSGGGGGGGGGASVSQKPYNVKINVENQKEGPRFHPDVKVVTLSEDHSSIDLTKIITNYAAIDTDTQQTVTNVRYSGFLKVISLPVSESLLFNHESFMSPHMFGLKVCQNS